MAMQLFVIACIFSNHLISRYLCMRALLRLPPLHLSLLIRLKPRGNILSIPLEPVGACLELIQALRQNALVLDHIGVCNLSVTRSLSLPFFLPFCARKVLTISTSDRAERAGNTALTAFLRPKLSPKRSLS